jgi:general secretion pathway protein K
MMGAPPFGSPKTFVKILQGKSTSPVGMLARAAGLEPVTLDSEENAMKAMTTESKVFSIYAIGVVRSGKRESRIRTHTVVDFRGAPPPGQEADPNEATAGATQPAPKPDSTASGSDSGSDNALKRATEASPAGNVVYFRVD